MNITLRPKGQLTLPADIRREANIAEGDVVEAVVIYDGCILLRPSHTNNGNGTAASVSDDWATPEWRHRIERSLAEIEAGLGHVFHSDDDFLDSLDD